MIDAALLAFALAGVAWFAWPTDDRPRTRVRWVVRATLAFALPALATLAVLGRWKAWHELPAEFAPLAALLPRYAASALLPAILLGMPLGLAIVGLRLWWARRRGRPPPRAIVAPAPLAARRPGELLPAAAVAVTAGLTEELAFRLAIPLLTARLIGSALAGFALATAAFLILHRYQSWPGRIGVLASAAALAALYLSTGALWLAMLVHALIDVAALALRPWLAGFARGVPSPRSP